MKAEFATATFLVTLGVILGKVNPLQLILITMAEVFMYSVNRFVCEHILEAVDPGGAIYVHLFGAVFGLGVARMIYNPRSVAHDEEVSSYHSDLFSMLGTCNFSGIILQIKLFLVYVFMYFKDWS